MGRYDLKASENQSLLLRLLRRLVWLLELGRVLLREPLRRELARRRVVLLSLRVGHTLRDTLRHTLGHTLRQPLRR